VEEKKNSTLNRREFIKGSMIGLASLPAFGYNPLLANEKKKKVEIALFKTQNREEGVREVLKLVDFPPVKGKKIMLKPNFNTADPTPGSTHNDTLTALIKELRKRGAAQFTVGERSGPPPLRKSWKKKEFFSWPRSWISTLSTLKNWRRKIGFISIHPGTIGKRVFTSPGLLWMRSISFPPAA